MSSNCDSDGCPVDHDGNKLEDGVFHSGARVAVRSDIFHEIFSGAGKDMSGMHIDAHPLEGSWVRSSSLVGGIPVVEQVEVEDLGEDSGSDEPLSPKSAMELCKNETSATVHAMLRTSKHERDALIDTRRKLADALGFLKSQGFKEEQIFDKQLKDGFGGLRIPSRDEFGLPKLGVKPQSGESQTTGNPFVEKLKQKVELRTADDMFDKLPKSQTPVFVEASKVSEEVPKSPKPSVGVLGADSQPKSWSQVVKEPSSSVNKVSFSYLPPPAGESIVSPPDDVLRDGMNKLKTTIVGSFTKGTASYQRVVDFANKFWKGRGLVHVGQKDSNTFLFRFDSEFEMNKILSKGTWYVDRRPLVVHAWGTKVNSVTTMPLWVRFDGVPDCYWNEQCLSRLASAIGPPLCADELTSKLEVLPFAKMCVNYTIGDVLPTSIPVTVLDPCSGDKKIDKVLVSYRNRPLICTACKSLGHLIGSCPSVTRKWVQKSNANDGSVDAPHKNSPAATPVVKVTDSKLHSPDPAVSDTVPSGSQTKGVEHTPAKIGLVSPADQGSDESATPAKNFRNLRNVDEVDMKTGVQMESSDVGEFQLTRSQRKRLKRAKGKSPANS